MRLSIAEAACVSLLKVDPEPRLGSLLVSGELILTWVDANGWNGDAWPPWVCKGVGPPILGSSLRVGRRAAGNSQGGWLCDIMG